MVLGAPSYRPSSWPRTVWPTQHGGHPGGAVSLSASVPCRSRARKIRYCMRSAATWSINRVRGPGVRLDSPRHNSGPYRPEPQRAARPRSTLERALGAVVVHHGLFALPSCLAPLRPHWQISGLKPSARPAISWLNLVQPPCVCSPPFRAPKRRHCGALAGTALNAVRSWLSLSLLPTSTPLVPTPCVVLTRPTPSSASTPTMRPYATQRR